MGTEERKEEFKEKINKLIEEFIDLSPEDIKNVFDYFYDGTYTINKKEPKDIVVQRFYAEYLKDDGIWFKKGDKRHGYLAENGIYYMSLHEPDFSSIRIYFSSYEEFNESWKVIE